MTEYLIAARAAIILWATIAVMPAEFAFDAIEAELERPDALPDMTCIVYGFVSGGVT